MMRLRPDLQDAAAEAIAGQAVVDPLANQSPDHISETPTKEVLRLYPPISFLLRERISAACQTRRAWQPPPRRPTHIESASTLVRRRARVAFIPFTWARASVPMHVSPTSNRRNHYPVFCVTAA